ncbi:MAG: transglutaminase family protein [Porphyrobacter sp.]|nr:transglutaminase family protein [Porphyrobacter sp.]
MLIRTGFDLCFRSAEPIATLGLLDLRPEYEPQLRTPQRIETEPAIDLHQFSDHFGNLCTRFVLPPGDTWLRSDFVVELSDAADPVVPDAIRHPVQDLPDDTLQFLLGSRYCEVGKLTTAAWGAANPFESGWDKVQAVVDLAHRQIAFGYAYARNDRTAFEGYSEGCGVCRDFAHLAITLCRELGIPARYCTGYLGDIGIDPIDAPMDFSAWFEAYVGGQWHTFDARHNRPRVARIVMARGRDATDTAITTHFGPAQLVHFHVHTDEVADTDLSRPPNETALPQFAGKFG